MKRGSGIRRVAFFSLLGAWSAAPAQVAPAANDPVQTHAVVLDALTVTGSNLRRIETGTALPVSILDREDLALRAAPTAAELLQMLPNGGVLSLTEANVLGADARGDNTALNLRGIGSGNTLVLLNGRRLAPHPISQTEDGVPSLAVNVNQLPVAAIDRVEVLRAGASAIYGADAAAGVVNTILRQDYDGYELSLRGGVTQHGGGDDWRATLSGGETFNGGRTNLVAMLDTYHRDLLGTKDREFSRDADVRRVRALPEPWSTTDTDFDNRSSASQYGNFVRGRFDAAGAFVGARPEGNRGITTSTAPSASLTTSASGVFFLVPLAAGGTGFRQTTPSRAPDSVERDYYYNIDRDRVILPATDRVNFNGALTHQLTPRLSAFGELAFYRADSFSHRDPVAADSTNDVNLYVGADNPFNPFGSRFYDPAGAPNADGTPRIVGSPADVLFAGGTGARPRDFPVRNIDVHSQSLRSVGGLRGAAGGDFTWESAVLYSRAWTRDEEENNVRHSLLQQALVRSDATAFNPCGYIFRNVGGTVQIDQPYANPASIVDSLLDTFVREGRTELATWDARLSGSLFDFWGGRVGAALGAEYRWESYKDWRPPYHGLNPVSDTTTPFLPRGADNDFIALSPNLNLYSERNVVSGYGELLVPIIGPRNRQPLLEVLELSLAGRYERFSDFGATFKPRYDLAWRPTKPLLVRAGYSESFRAPNLVQTNPSPLQRSVAGVTDVYRSAATGLITDGPANRTVFRQGNASLEPEESSTATVGIVLEVPRVMGLTFSIDWWRLDQKHVIDNLAAAGVLTRDDALLLAYTQEQIAAGTPVNNINTHSGAADYHGNPKVTRAPVTDADREAFAAYNASRPAAEQRAPVGRLVSLIDDYVNIAGRDLEGFDLALSYRLPKWRAGQFTLRAEATYNRKFDQQLDEFSAPESVLLEDGRAKWRGNASVSWKLGNWSAGWFAEYYGGSMDAGATTTAAVYEQLGRPDYIRVFNDVGGIVRYRWWIKSSIQHNAYVQYRFGDNHRAWRNTSIRCGVTNVFDAAPPIADENRGYQDGTVSAKGRAFYLEISRKL